MAVWDDSHKCFSCVFPLDQMHKGRDDVEVNAVSLQAVRLTGILLPQHLQLMWNDFLLLPFHLHPAAVGQPPASVLSLVCAPTAQ